MNNRQAIGRLGICFYLVLFILMFLLVYSEGGIPLPRLILAVVFWAGLIPLITTLSILKWKKKGEHLWKSEIVFGFSIFLQYCCSIMSAHATYLQSVSFFAISAAIMTAVMFFYKRKQEQ